MKTIKIRTWEYYGNYTYKWFEGLATVVVEKTKADGAMFCTIFIMFDDQLENEVRKIIDKVFSSYTEVA